MHVRLLDQGMAVVYRMRECAGVDGGWKATSWTDGKSWRAEELTYRGLVIQPSLQRSHLSSTSQHLLEMCSYHSQRTCES